MVTRLLAILAALLFSGSPAAAQTLIDNINGISIARDGEVTRFSAMVISSEGVISHLVERGDAPPKQLDYRVDGRGRTVIPGFVDSHVQLMDIGFAALTLDLSDTNSLAQAQVKIAAYAAHFPDRGWIIGTGWDERKWGLDHFPTSAELDAAVSDRPVWLIHADGHAGLANGPALDFAGITAKSADPLGGRIERLAGSRTPSGLLVDNAMQLVETQLPAPRPEDRDMAFLTAQELLIKRGITAIADMGITIEDWQSYRRAGDADQLRLRIMAYAENVADMEVIGGPGPSPWLYQDRLRFNGLMLTLDGTIAPRGAWLKAPYADAPGNSGIAHYSHAQLRNLMSRAGIDHFQVALFASGDAAADEALAAIEELAETYGGKRRWRIENARLVDPADMARLAGHDIIVSMRPAQQVSDIALIESRLGPDRLSGTHAARSITGNGGILAFGSGANGDLPDPFAAIAAAITRADDQGQPFGGWQPQEAVARETAMAAYTSGAAYAGYGDGHFGELAVGQRADFLMVDQDPFLVSTDDLRKTRILEVWIGGVQVHDASPAPKQTDSTGMMGR